MSDVSPSMDIDDINGIIDIAEEVGGTVALTAKGRIIIYGVVDAAGAAARLNTPGTGFGFYVEVLGPTTLGLAL